MDLSLSGANQSVHQDVASGTVSFSGGSDISYYQLVRSEDDVWPAATTPTPSGTDQELGAVGNTTIPSFAVSGNNWPSAGETYYYRVRARLRGNFGGGGQDSDLVWVSSPFSNSITRGAVLTAPVVNSSQASLNSATESATITASVALSSPGSPTGGTTSYTIFTSGTAYSANNSFTVTRGTSLGLVTLEPVATASLLPMSLSKFLISRLPRKARLRAVLPLLATPHRPRR